MVYCTIGSNPLKDMPPDELQIGTYPQQQLCSVHVITTHPPDVFTYYVRVLVFKFSSQAPLIWSSMHHTQDSALLMQSAYLSMYVMLPTKIGVHIYFQAPSTFDLYIYFAPSQIGVLYYLLVGTL